MVALIFLGEQVLRFCANGDATHFFKQWWHVLDVVILSVSWMLVILPSASSWLISIRVVIPMRLITAFSSQRTIIQALINSVRRMLIPFSFLVLSYFALSVVGMVLFSGRLRQCIDLSTSQVVKGVDRVGCVPPWVWSNPPQFGSFDNIASSVLLMFELSTEENWPNTMYNFVDATPPGQANVTDYNQFVAIYFVLAVAVTSLFVKDMFVGAVLDGYSSQHEEMNGTASLTVSEKSWFSYYRYMVDNMPMVRTPRPRGMRGYLHDIISHHLFERIMVGFVLASSLVLGMFYHQSSRIYRGVLEAVTSAFLLVFALEMIFKLAVMGRKYFQNMWNGLDAVVTCAGLVAFVIRLYLHGSLMRQAVYVFGYPIHITSVLALRSLRLLTYAVGICIGMEFVFGGWGCDVWISLMWACEMSEHLSHRC
jgi:hypothetical protein